MCGNACRVFGEAWHKVKGMKKPFWGGFALTALIGCGGYVLLLLILLLGQVLYFPGLLEMVRHHPFFFLEGHYAVPIGLVLLLLLYHLGQALFEMFVMLPMRMGMFLIPLRHVTDKSTDALYVFKFLTWEYIWRFAVLEALIVLVLGIPTGVGVALFVVPKMLGVGIVLKSLCYLLGTVLYLFVIYLGVAYLFSAMLIIDRKMSPWKAMETSRIAVTKRWFCVWGALIWMWVSIIIGAALLLVGLIWAVPYTQNIIIILYRDLMGIEGKDPVSIEESR